MARGMSQKKYLWNKTSFQFYENGKRKEIGKMSFYKGKIYKPNTIILSPYTCRKKLNGV